MKRLTDYYVDPLEGHQSIEAAVHVAQRRQETARLERARAERGRLLAFGCVGLALGIYVGAALFSATGPVDQTDELPPGIPLYPDAAAPAAPPHTSLPPIADDENVAI